jgi:hypothetical protein
MIFRFFFFFFLRGGEIEIEIKCLERSMDEQSVVYSLKHIFKSKYKMKKMRDKLPSTVW